MAKDKDHKRTDSYIRLPGAHTLPAPIPPLLQKSITKLHSTLPATVGSLQAFTTFLASPSNSIVATTRPEDWSHPLNEYFISSSHNTYLTGHQLYGSSTTKGYVEVLERGGRCIEIDVWDGDDGEPEVFHGYTLTKEISFKDVCRAIVKYAFTGPGGDGPVIISLECHAGEEQQHKMVRIMEEVWGERLVKDIDPEAVTALPSPETLRGRIVVKAKYTPPPPPPGRVETALRGAKEGVKEVKSTAKDTKSSIKQFFDSSDSSDSSDDELAALAAAAKKQKPPKSKMIRPLSRLGAYCSSHHFPSRALEPFTAHQTSLIANHVYSFSEKVFARLHEDHAPGIFTHNRSFLMRVYPFGLRFSSSNADPTEFWKRGVQMVALNWQKCDEGMMLNEGMFAGCGGYVLKPPGFRPGDTEKPVYKKLDLTIDVIAGANLPLPNDDDTARGFNPYVKIEVHTAGDGKAKPADVKRKTKSKKGVECVWEQRLEWVGVEGVVEKLTFVRFKVHDEEFGKDDLGGWACVRLDRVQTGPRLVRLFDSEGRQTHGVLLVNVVKLEVRV